jgi:carbonic anhydrase|tara:strand:- start:37 stop:729 length:693 start_codon:yes stop_codon:yes gene_type:complete
MMSTLRFPVTAALAIGLTIFGGVLVTHAMTETLSPETPNAAIADLMSGNARYVEGKVESHNLPAARAGLAQGQAPFAAIIRCADSRVSPEIVFDQPLGELFVCAVAGNVPTPEIIASLEYGVAVLGCKAIVIMGHSSCGAVIAAMENRDDTSVLPGSLPALIDQIVVPCVENADIDAPDAINKAVACNAHEGISKLLKGSEILSNGVKDGSLKIVSGVQDLKSGKFTLGM